MLISFLCFVSVYYLVDDIEIVGSEALIKIIWEYLIIGGGYVLILFSHIFLVEAGDDLKLFCLHCMIIWLKIMISLKYLRPFYEEIVMSFSQWKFEKITLYVKFAAWPFAGLSLC